MPHLRPIQRRRSTQGPRPLDQERDAVVHRQSDVIGFGWEDDRISVRLKKAPRFLSRVEAARGSLGWSRGVPWGTSRDPVRLLH